MALWIEIESTKPPPTAVPVTVFFHALFGAIQTALAKIKRIFRQKFFESRFKEIVFSY
jgi:hypothetical protein